MYIMFTVLHRPIIYFHKTLIYIQEPQAFILCCLCCFFDSQNAGSCWLAFYESQGQLKFFFTVLKKKVTFILDGLRVSKLTTHFHFWVNYPFKSLSLSLSLSLYLFILIVIMVQNKWEINDKKTHQCIILTKNQNIWMHADLSAQALLSLLSNLCSDFQCLHTTSCWLLIIFCTLWYRLFSVRIRFRCGSMMSSCKERNTNSPCY